jgi:hypothetical protein
MKLSDKQRIDFVQSKKCYFVQHFQDPVSVLDTKPPKPIGWAYIFPHTAGYGNTFRQAVDRAYRAYQEGRK